MNQINRLKQIYDLLIKKSHSYSDLILYFEKEKHTVGIRQLQRDLRELPLVVKNDEKLIKFRNTENKIHFKILKGKVKSSKKKIEIENKIEDKFGSFNVELRYMQQSDGKGKKSLVNESEEEDQKLINKTKLIYKGLKKGGKIGFSPVDSPYHEVHWTLPNKFYVKIKHRNKRNKNSN